MGLKIPMKSQVSPQYLREGKINVTIIEAKSPVHYVIKESPSMNTASTYASKFLELEESMQKYYRSLEKTFFQLPVKDTILIVEYEKKFYRAKVCSILNLPTSYLIKVYLLDYGKECSVSKNNLFEMHPDFMSVQFQAVDFKLPGLDPMSLVMNSLDMSVEYGTAVDWDPSAFVFIENICKALHNAFVKVEGASKNVIYGTLHVTLQDGEEKCINDELVFKKFSSQNPECWNNIIRLADILSKENVPSNANILPSLSNNPEVPVPSSVISESLLASELSSPESLKSVKSPTVSIIVSEPLKNEQKSGVAKLREILRAKKSQEQSKPLPEREKELPIQSTTNGLCLKQKDMIKETKETKTVLVEDIKDVCDPANDAVKITEHSTERESITIIENPSKSNVIEKDALSSSNGTTLKSLDENKYEQSVSPSPNQSTFKKFKEMVAKNRAAQKQQNISQTMNDNACANSPSQILQQKTNSLPLNPCAVELEKSEKLSQDTDISQNRPENGCTDSCQSHPTCGTFLEVKSILQPSKSVPVQNVGVNESQPTVKSDNELSVGSQASLEKGEVSKKVDPSKIRAFFERSKKARAIFLAQNKTKQDKDDTNTDLATTSPILKPSETGTQLAVCNTKNNLDLSEPSSTQTGTELASIENKNVVESYVDNSDASKIEFVNKQVESHKSVESQSSTGPKEFVKPKVDPAKIKAFFKRSKKDRALFLAKAKYKQDEDNKNSQSVLTSPSLEVCRPSDTDSISTISPEAKSVVASVTNVPDILELVNESTDSNSNR